MSMHGIGGLKTRGQLATAVSNFVEDTSTNGVELIRNFLDLGYLEALKRADWPTILRWHESAVIVAAGDLYIHGPKNVRTILKIVDTTNPMNMEAVDAYSLINEQRGFGSISGSPSQFAFVGTFGSNVAIAAATTVEVLSSAADTRTGLIRGLRGGEMVSAGFTLNGATPVSISQTFDEILQFTVDTHSTTRTAGLRRVSDQVTLATIGVGEQSAEYMRFKTLFLPAESTVFRMLYKYTPPPIYDDAHQYIVPIEGYLYEFACGFYMEKRRQDSLADRHFARAEASLLRTLSEILNQAPTVAAPYGYENRPIGIVIAR